MVMKKSDIQDEIMQKIQRKIDKDIESYIMIVMIL